MTKNQEHSTPVIAAHDLALKLAESRVMNEIGTNYDRPGDLFPRCEDCGKLYGCMLRECPTCPTTNLCHGCAERSRAS